MQHTISQVIDAAAEEFGVNRRMLTSKRRDRKFSWPRFAVMKVCSKRLGRSQSTIAREIGFDDHTSVGHGIKRCREICADHPDFAQKLARLERLFSDAPQYVFYRHSGAQERRAAQ